MEGSGYWGGAEQEIIVGALHPLAPTKSAPMDLIDVSNSHLTRSMIVVSYYWGQGSNLQM